MEDIIPRRQGRGRQRKRWVQDVKGTLNISIDELETWPELDNLSDGL
jgi:hypothetical protein